MMTLGIDPGGAHTGVCLLDGDQVRAHAVLDRDGAPIHLYAADVARQVVDADEVGVDLVAIEGLVRVTPQMGNRPIDLFPTVEAAVVLGAVHQACHGRGWPVEMVRPGGHGSQPLYAYPQQLVGPRESKGTGRLRHARSAYDVALAGRRQHRLGGAA